MRKFVLQFFLICFLFLTSAKAITNSKFEYLSELKGAIKENKLYAVTLPVEALQKSSANYSDIRLLDQNNNEIPYVIIKNKFVDMAAESYRFEIANYEEDANSAVVTVKFADKDKHKPIREIYLSTNNRDFKKDITLEASYDMQNWNVLGKTTIYDFSSKVDLRKTLIEFTSSDFNYYRIRITESKASGEQDSEAIKLKYKDLEFSAGNTKGENKIHISEIIGRTNSARNESDVRDRMVFNNFSSQLEENGDTSIIVDASLPFDRLYFDVSNPYFYRNVTIYYSDTGDKNSYAFLTQSQICRFPISGYQETKDYIEYSTPKHKYYKFVIQNNNNPALSLNSIKFEWIQATLFFMALGGAQNYSLYFGNSVIKNPSYDLSSFISQSNWSNNQYEKLSASPMVANPSYNAKDAQVTEDSRARQEKMALIAVVIALSIGIGYWLYALIKKTSTH